MENFCVFFSNRSWGNHYSPCHSPSCLKKWAGKERKSWRMKKKRKKQIHYLKVGGDFCYGKTCNIPLTQLSPPIRWEGCVPAQRGLGDRPISFLWWRDTVVAPCPSSRVLQQLQDKAGKRRQMEEMANGGNRLKSVLRVGDQKESTLGTVWENLCKCRHQNLTWRCFFPD